METEAEIIKWGADEIERLSADNARYRKALEDIESYNQECRAVSCSYTSAMVIGALEPVLGRQKQ